MRRGLGTEKDRFAKRRKSKLTTSHDEIGSWLGERLRAALADEAGEKQELRLTRDASGEPVDKALM
jgi:hypothetical protein